MSSGTLAPGLSPGCLSSGNLSYSGGTLQIEIAGTTVCTEYDQQTVTGTVMLGSATTLDVSFLSSFVPALNDEFIIISNDDTDAVTGTFVGMADGSSFDVAGVTFEINYDGGDGNDVVLSAVSVPTTVTAPDTGAASLLTNPAVAVAAMAGVLVMVGALRFADSK